MGLKNGDIDTSINEPNDYEVILQTIERELNQEAEQRFKLIAYREQLKLKRDELILQMEIFERSLRQFLQSERLRRSRALKRGELVQLFDRQIAVQFRTRRQQIARALEENKFQTELIEVELRLAAQWMFKIIGAVGFDAV